MFQTIRFRSLRKEISFKYLVRTYCNLLPLTPRLQGLQFAFSKHVDYSGEINEISTYAKWGFIRVKQQNRISQVGKYFFLLSRSHKKSFAGLNHATRILLWGQSCSALKQTLPWWQCPKPAASLCSKKQWVFFGRCTTNFAHNLGRGEGGRLYSRKENTYFIQY